jgi:Legionella pneumophila major outer membrane protein precursor
MKSIFSILLLAITTQVASFGEAEQYGASIDYLYWKAFNVALDFRRVTQGDRINKAQVDPTYDSGVRGEIWFRPNCAALGLIGRYYWVDTRQSQTFANDQEPLQVHGGLKTYYQAGDVLLSYRFCPRQCFSWEALAGAKILYLATDTRTGETRQTSIVDSFNHQRFAGGGVAIGLAACWTPWCPLDLFAEAQYGALFGSRRSSFVSLRSPGTSIFTRPNAFGSYTREVDLRAGGRFRIQRDCVAIGLELGWEARAYRDYLVFGNSGAALAGLFAGLTASF